MYFHYGHASHFQYCIIEKMNACTTLSSRLREVLLDGHWIANTNFKEKLSDVTWEQATKKIGSLNTIAALTFHVNYYLKGILHFFKGGKLEIRDKYSFEMPPVNSVSDWNKLVEEFLSNAEEFIRHVAEMPEARLDEPFFDEKYGSYQRNIEGMIEHSYYHLGQISLIKKMVLEIENRELN